jgi:16S rRNA processing protein RimM
MVLVGRVARAHGNRGQVIVNLETDFPEDRFRAGQVVYVEAAGSARPSTVPRRIMASRFHQGRPIVALEGIETMDDAEALAGAGLWVPEAALPPLPAATYYRHDLIGCQVKDVRDAAIGTVTDVHGPMDRSYLVVAGVRGEVLIPLVDQICVRVDPSSRVIVVDPPEGLLDANER